MRTNVAGPKKEIVINMNSCPTAEHIADAVTSVKNPRCVVPNLKEEISAPSQSSGKTVSKTDHKFTPTMTYNSEEKEYEMRCKLKWPTFRQNVLQECFGSPFGHRNGKL